MPASTRKGSQVPTFTTAPPEAALGDAGRAALDLFAAYGVEFYGSQAYELRLMTARDGGGDFAAKSIYIAKPRQNGKSYGARFYCIYCAAVLGMRVLYTAHRARTARKMFRAIADFVQGSGDWRRALVYPQGIYKATGYEGVYFTDPRTGGPGGSIEFMTRGPGVRGDTADVIVIDEAQELTADQEEALLPASIAGSEVTRKLSQQVVYIGTPPDEKTRGTVFQDAHDKAHAGVLYGSWWLEWAAEKPIGPEATQAEALAVMYATNPAIGYRIREENLLERWAKMTPEGFAREHLGWWADYRTSGVLIDAATWDAAATQESAPPGIRCVGVKFEPSGLRASLCVAVRPQEGPYRIEQAGQYDTTHGLEALMADLLKMAPKCAEICADGGGFAQTLCERLIARGVPAAKIHRPSSIEISAAASNLLSMLKDGQVCHWAGEGQRLLDESATMTARRSVGRSGGFSFASTEDAYAEPIEAAALALLWALKTRKDPAKKARIY